MISNKLVIDFYELDNSKYGIILIKKGKYSQCVVDYEDIISGSFINSEDNQQHAEQRGYDDQQPLQNITQQVRTPP